MIRRRRTARLPQPVRHGPSGGRQVALTFDDGPCARTAEIADILASHGARATFFVIGKGIPEHEDLLRRLVSCGHEIGNHSFNHPKLAGKPLLSVYQIARTGRRVRAVVGSAPRLFRPPHTRFDAWVLLAARLTGVTLVTWSLDPLDWSPTTTPPELHDHVAAAVRDGDIVVLHDNELEWTPTLTALPGILRTLQARGYRMVTVSELLGLSQDPFRDSAQATVTRTTEQEYGRR
jgi:peptidoglycan/xylan/chitin deacetylase (PgdA/CDA1 family)